MVMIVHVSITRLKRFSVTASVTNTPNMFKGKRKVLHPTFMYQSWNLLVLTVIYMFSGPKLKLLEVSRMTASWMPSNPKKKPTSMPEGCWSWRSWCTWPAETHISTPEVTRLDLIAIPPDSLLWQKVCINTACQNSIICQWWIPLVHCIDLCIMYVLAILWLQYSIFMSFHVYILFYCNVTRFLWPVYCLFFAWLFTVLKRNCCTCTCPTHEKKHRWCLKIPTTQFNMNTESRNPNASSRVFTQPAM